MQPILSIFKGKTDDPCLDLLFFDAWKRLKNTSAYLKWWFRGDFSSHGRIKHYLQNRCKHIRLVGTTPHSPWSRTVRVNWKAGWTFLPGVRSFYVSRADHWKRQVCWQRNMNLSCFWSFCNDWKFSALNLPNHHPENCKQWACGMILLLPGNTVDGSAIRLTTFWMYKTLVKNWELSTNLNRFFLPHFWVGGGRSKQKPWIYHPPRMQSWKVNVSCHPGADDWILGRGGKPQKRFVSRTIVAIDKT